MGADWPFAGTDGAAGRCIHDTSHTANVHGFLWYCSNQNLRFFKGLQRSAFNSSTSDLFVDIEENDLIGSISVGDEKLLTLSSKYLKIRLMQESVFHI